MELFVVLCEDRHADAEPYVFTDLRAAIEYAENDLANNPSAQDWPDDIEYSLNDSMIKSGWLYHVNYSSEGDSIRVQRKILDEPDAPGTS